MAGKNNNGTGFNVRDWIFYNVIEFFMSGKEWHSFWRGFFAGMSFGHEGWIAKNTGKVFGVDHSKTDVKMRDYRSGYATGEVLARIVIIIVVFWAAQHTGTCGAVVNHLFGGNHTAVMGNHTINATNNTSSIGNHTNVTSANHTNTSMKPANQSTVHAQ